MCVCVRISPSGWDGPRLKWPLPPLLLSSLNVVCSREAVSEKHHLGISDHFSSHVFWKWARWATKGGKKIPYGSFVPRSSFSKACWGEVEGMKLCPGISLKHRERLKFCGHLRIVWLRVSVCVSYGNVSLSHFVVWGEKAGLIALSWPYLSPPGGFSACFV